MKKWRKWWERKRRIKEKKNENQSKSKTKKANPGEKNNKRGGFAMHISWNFLNKRKATIDAIEAYHNMEFIIHNTDDELARVQAKME